MTDKWSLGIYGSGKPPVLGTVNLDEIEEKARDALKDNLPAFMYVYGSAGSCSTYAANRAAFARWKIIPRMLVNATERSLKTTLFGVEYKSPVILAPVGVQGILHADGELAAARAAGKANVPMIMSSASSRSIEAVAEANGQGSPRWYQLYWPRTSEVTLSIIKRAKENGFTALLITLDTMLLGWRPHDLETAYLPFRYGVGIQVGTSDPVFMARYGLEPRHDSPPFPFDPQAIRAQAERGDAKAQAEMDLGGAWLAEVNSGLFRSWEDVKFIRDNWDGPLILKGIQRVADAEKAIDINVDGIVVSNHGGRQVDGAIASLDALNKICHSPKIKRAQKSGKLTVLFDSGIRNGSDIIKALALGAQGVLLARPYLYGLAIAGEEGVAQVIDQTLDDLNITMALSGYKEMKEIIGKRDEVVTDTGIAAKL